MCHAMWAYLKASILRVHLVTSIIIDDSRVVVPARVNVDRTAFGWPDDERLVKFQFGENFLARFMFFLVHSIPLFW
jgi:hypothetical protein